jgi:hypothetical protein
VWTLVYQWDNQNYSQISIPGSLSKLKLDRAFSLDLGLKREKIDRNVTKVGVDARLPMRHPKLFSNFNSEKLVKVENRPCVFARLRLKGEKIARNITNVGVRICLPTGHPNLCSIFNSEKLVQFETRPCVFARLGLKGVENSSERRESWCGRLSTNGTSKTILKFQFREVG